MTLLRTKLGGEGGHGGSWGNFWMDFGWVFWILFLKGKKDGDFELGDFCRGKERRKHRKRFFFEEERMET